MRKKILAILFLMITLVDGCSIEKQIERHVVDNEIKNEVDSGLVIPNDAKEYIQSKEISDINLLIDSSHKGIGSIYSEYCKSKNPLLLKELSPIDVFRMYNTANKENKPDIVVSLVKVSQEIGKVKFLDEVKNDSVSRENQEKLINELERFKGKVIERIIDEQNAYIIIENYGWYRMEKEENGVWNVGWLARQ